MTDLKISQMNDAASLTGNEVVPLVQSGGNVKATTNVLKDFISLDVSNMADTWNDGLTAFTAIKMNVTDTASAADSFLLNLLVGGESKFSVGKDGSVTADGMLIDSSGNVGIGTTSPATALDVVGAVTADGLTVDGAASIGSSTAKTKFYSDSTYNGIYNGSGLYANESIYMGAGSLFFYTATDQRMKIDSSGDISFYEDTGTTPKFFWDASAEALGIGTTTPAQKLDVTGGYALLDGLRIGGGDTTNTIYQATGALSLSTGSASGIVFKTNLTDRMAIDTSGNVGIGTSSPQTKVDITGSSTTEVSLRVGNAEPTEFSLGVLFSSGSAYNYIGIGAGETALYGRTGLILAADNPGSGYKPIRFSTGGTERMRIDSSGNVGIGTTSALGKFDSYSTTVGSNGWYMAGNFGAPQYPMVRLYAATPGKVSSLGNNGDGSLHFYVNGSTSDIGTYAGQFDSSGNLLVGKTSADNTTAGGSIFAGVSSFVNDGARALTLVRNTSDGDIVEFRKGGTTVGSIGANNGDAYIGTGDTGIIFSDGNDAIIPFSTTAENFRGSAIDLGYSTYPFKDLILSGGIYLGGTGAANYLDDYEEGTWTGSVTVNGFTQTVSSIAGTYTKVGRLVTIHYTLSLSSAGYASSYSLWTGLPYTAASTSQASGYYATGSISGNIIGSTHYIDPNSANMYLFQSTSTSSSASWQGSFSYYTA